MLSAPGSLLFWTEVGRAAAERRRRSRSARASARRRTRMLGSPAAAFSMKSKSRVRFSAPSMTMTTLIPMPNGVGRTGSGDPPREATAARLPRRAAQYPRRRYNYGCEAGRDLDDAEAVEEVDSHEYAKRGDQRLRDDPLIPQFVVAGGDAKQRTLAQSVQDGGDRRGPVGRRRQRCRR